LAVCLTAARLSAADSEAPPKPTGALAGGTNLTLSASAAAKRGAWQQHLTLGAGDSLNLMLFGMPETAVTEVPIAPDGRISFLQARDITAEGLSIDELRAKLDQALAKYYQNPRTIITPASFRSKKYFVLGAVAGKGVYGLDRPLTVVEALARAGGLETGMYEHGTVELADLPHSFLVRNGQRVPVDFERLFAQGDLSQNVPMEPDDYLYIAVANANEIYVLGEVGMPGVAAFLPRTTVISTIASRGGFTVRAFKSRVLVVRGSFAHPQTFIVNAGAIMTGKAPDFKLQAKDIIYVSQSPWVRAEEIIDTAATAFIQGVVVGTTGRKVGPLLPIDMRPIIK
jgi:protein involved in polysaccharide export with SLBB domain